MRLLCCFAMMCLAHFASGQYRILGFVYDAREDPYSGVEVQLKGDAEREITYTDPEGRFEFINVARGDYTVLVVTDYGLIKKHIKVRTSIEMHLQRSRNIKTDEVIVYAVRAANDGPIAHINLNKEEIETGNLGQDVPFLLKWTPSIVATSDAGTGIGYSGIRIRGTDPTRINITINDVPLNDAESQAVFWVDLPDILSSTESIQIQRGVGSSTFGTGAFGASINLNTIKTQIKPFAKISGSLGSFSTYKANVQFGSGLLNNQFTIDGRISTVQSDGYIDRGTADLQSFYLSAAWIGAKSSLRLLAFGGTEVTYQAWNGVPAQYIDDPVLRTFNTAGTEKLDTPYDNQVDDYSQTHFQLHWNTSVFTQVQSFVTLHYTKGKGFFEQYKNPLGFESFFAEYLAMHGLADHDAIRRRWLDNDFFGALGGIHYLDPGGKYDFRIGAGSHKYLGDHFGEVIWTASGVTTDELPLYYSNDAEKTDKTLFAKLNYKLGSKWKVYADLQLRGVRYKFKGLDNDGSPVTQDVRHKFFNPKMGISYNLNQNSKLHYYAGIAQREPNRDDYVSSSPSSRPLAERLFDQEIGYRLIHKKWQLDLNGYWMQYHDHLTLTGQINDVGEYTRRNVDKSSRLGLETNLDFTPTDRWIISAGATISRNKIEAFDEFVDNWDYWNQDFDNTPPEQLEPQQFQRSHTSTDLAFSPGLIMTGQIGYHLVRSEKHQLSATFMTKYVGEQFIDNTGNEASVLDAYSFTDLKITYQFNWSGQCKIQAHLLVRNIFDAQFISNAWIYRFRSRDWDPRDADPYAELEQGDVYHLKGLFPQAGRNVLLGLTVSI